MNATKTQTQSRHRLARTALALAVLATTACSSLTQPGAGAAADPALQAVVDLPDDTRATRSPQLAAYRKVLFEPTAWRVAGESTPLIESADQQALSQQLDGALARELAGYEVVAAAGPGVLRVRSAIREIDTSSPVGNVLLTLLVLAPADLGGATVDVQASDALSGQPLAQMTTAARGSVLSTGGFRRLGHARQAMDKAAERFAVVLATDAVGN